MREQIDLFRRRGLGPATNGSDVGELVKTMSVQVAMLRYLDNDQNYAASPNQNFARELMELFLLGVGNYTEADVEAATAAWTGHTRPRWDIDEYVFDPDRHENAPQQFLGRTINDTRPAIEAGNETIEVILGIGPLGSGTIPSGAEKNRGRPSAEVAAEFLTYKLWQEFGEATSGSVPAGVGSVMTTALLDNDFAIRPWVRAMLVHDDFYADATKTGLVRQPVEFVRRTAERTRAHGRGGGTAVADGPHRSAAVVSAERQRVEAQWILGQRERDGCASGHRSGLPVGAHP